MKSSFKLQVGHSIWFDGQVWTVEKLAGEAVKLLSRDTKTSQLVATVALVGRAEPMDAETIPALDSSGNESPLGTVLLSSLPVKQRKRVLDVEAVILKLGTFEFGDSATERYETAAKILGLHPRSVRRLAAGYADRGIVALVDKRLTTALAPSIDPEWDRICRQVLASYTYASNPSRKAVLAKANRIYLDEYPAGKPPSRTVAYGRLQVLDNGRKTFGSAKQRRSIAERPNPPYGRLQASRPGEYILLDTNRLDVFAMEPVTLRPVNVFTQGASRDSVCVPSLPSLRTRPASCFRPSHRNDGEMDPAQLSAHMRACRAQWYSETLELFLTPSSSITGKCTFPTIFWASASD
jgi:putative transposase